MNTYETDILYKEVLQTGTMTKPHFKTLWGKEYGQSCYIIDKSQIQIVNKSNFVTLTQLLL